MRYNKAYKSKLSKRNNKRDRNPIDFLNLFRVKSYYIFSFLSDFIENGLSLSFIIF